MSRWINADAIKDKAWKAESEACFYALEDVVSVTDIDEAPSIDIVRCGECIHNGSYDTDCPFGWKNGEWNMPKPCDYCSYGEREDE